VTTDATVTAAASQDAATKSEAMNVVEMARGAVDSNKGADSYVEKNGLYGGITGRGYDIAKWNFERMNTSDPTPRHEFTHLLGVPDLPSCKCLSNGDNLNQNLPMKATNEDFAWALGGSVNKHLEQARPITFRGYGERRTPV